MTDNTHHRTGWTAFALLVALLIVFPTSARADWLLEIRDCTAFIRNMTVGKEARKPRAIRPVAAKPERDAAARYRPIIRAAARKYRVHPRFIEAVIKVESDFNPRAKSPAPANAMGLMQLTPATAEYLGVENPWDASQNIFGGTRYLKELLVEFKDPALALAGYNWGPTHVRRGERDYPLETRRHIRRVFREFHRLLRQEDRP
ncbi:Lytic transglycosylase catalytic [Pseudodesulfovibrio mercurii]|uniref:Lytic transglycosylase catalytic n=1 Tax=Pseudodesulfovibrio mercurii TaxID=641491 RepID=F0JCJ1_9BACT|nr:lytic transglycosylase domain-containing protein [Pseudodesulfovibrio mercurii]EGB15671.1 Lytic transglycosylase catalytic [Pseudodesulfovibrio mercurii]